MAVTDIAFASGYITITRDSGPPTKYPIANVLRALDIPDLTIDSLTLLTTLAQIVMVLVKTLIEKDILDEELVSGFDMQYMIDTLTDDLNAENV